MLLYGTYELANDITITNDFETIEKFMGILNGNGHTINNLNTALFNELEEATVYDLNINVNIDKEVSNTKAYGSLASRAVNSEINNVKLTGSMTINSTAGITIVGSLAGILEYTSVSNVNSLVNLNTTYATVGGLVGSIQNPESSSTIEKCVYEGVINANGNQLSYVGGFVGEVKNNSVQIKECAAVASITTNVSYTGGFVGYMGSGHINDCYVSGTLTYNQVSGIVSLGGFVGRLEGYNNTVKNCISNTEITANSLNTGANVFVGSFVGFTVGGTYGGNIYNNCYYNKTLSSYDRIGNPSNGRGDGISGLTTEELVNFNNTAFDSNIWTKAEDGTPILNIVK